MGIEDAGSLNGLVVLGKTAGALIVIVGLIFLVAFALKRLEIQRHNGGHAALRVVSSVGVGQKERVVVVQVEDSWLVLGVGGGQVTKLHELDAPPEPPARQLPADGSFGQRFGQALRQNLSGKGNSGQ